MIKLDISEDQYELYDFTESVIQFMGPLKNSDNLSLDVWGIIIPLKMFSIEQYGLSKDQFSFNDNIYIYLVFQLFDLKVWKLLILK